MSRMRLEAIRQRNTPGKPDYIILSILFILIIFGVIALSSASSNIGVRQFGDAHYFVKHQLLLGFGLGAILFSIMYIVPYRFYERFSGILLIFNIALLILVFTPLAFTAGGANRWIHLGPITFQPSEFLKITLLVYLAAWLSKQKERKMDFKKGLLPFLLVLGIISALLLGQPATSMLAILVATSCIMYFMSGASWKNIGIVMFIGIIGFGFLMMFTEYRFDRLTAFLNPDSDPLGSSYQIRQALTSIGSGGLFGVGYGQSILKISGLPEPIGDSIFAIIAEEFGFAGALFVIILFTALVARIFMLSRKLSDPFAGLILIGFGSLIGIQAFINIAAISGLIPLTGIPLPFISYGGTALLVHMAMMGIIVHISRYAKQ